mmetsp:Transcript_26376/g.80059  ORF Transcript_26376/g.80059 Transcript_26376/m.80059 type:complete len:244 (-) Transcript_26376:1690-2421(-)
MAFPRRRRPTTRGAPSRRTSLLPRLRLLTSADRTCVRSPSLGPLPSVAQPRRDINSKDMAYSRTASPSSSRRWKGRSRVQPNASSCSKSARRVNEKPSRVLKSAARCMQSDCTCPWRDRCTNGMHALSASHPESQRDGIARLGSTSLRRHIEPWNNRPEALNARQSGPARSSSSSELPAMRLPLACNRVGCVPPKAIAASDLPPGRDRAACSATAPKQASKRSAWSLRESNWRRSSGSVTPSM